MLPHHPSGYGIGHIHNPGYGHRPGPQGDELVSEGGDHYTFNAHFPNLTVVTITNPAGKYLSVDLNKTAGLILTDEKIETPTGDRASEWTLVQLEDTMTYEISNPWTVKVLDVLDGSKKEGASVIACPSNGKKDQLWEFGHGSKGLYFIRSVLSKKALECLDGKPDHIAQGKFTGAKHQLWYVTPVPQS